MDERELIAAWLHSLGARNYASGTIGNYRRTLDGLRAWSVKEGRSLAALTHVDVRAWLDLFDHAASTRYAAISTISHFYRWAICEEHLGYQLT